ncbi:recombinase family protein [Pseudarthrobacter sp. NCCP-2145]|uniref:recombinase family protein n=1 Tax=Pseudarthrobacter sp. NCCP-2145 TaxID=2942290 RepID=UPI00203BE26F|nr:recombinase family protein [Pseudarthrobacter sp. NCCP-2145]GKV71708.1 serine recombinase [Pseudarthrobacter sp. NCCP-2145]
MSSLKAAIYSRISDDRTGAGLGVARQEADCRALAEARGFAVHSVYTDNDSSAYSGKKRPGYHKLLADIAAGHINVVLAWHNDRLHRSLTELEEYIKISEDADVATICVQSGELDLSTSAGRMTARILGAVARQESEHKAERIKRAAQELSMSGKWTGGLRPFGWQFVDGVPTLEEAEAAVVREAHAHVLAGFSLGSFIQSLAERGITTARGGSWSYATLRQMLLRPRNAGLTAWEGEVVGPSEFPAIVDRHVWEATCSILKDPARRRSRTNKAKHLLAGIAQCAECLSPMKSAQITDRKGVKHNIYRCTTGGPGHVNKRMSYVDEHVERHILFFLAYAARTEASAPGDPATLERLRLDESAHRERLNEAARLFASGAIDGEQLTEMSKGIKAQLSDIQGRLAQLDEANAIRDQVEMSADIDWTDLGASEREWQDLHVERKRAWIRSRFVIVLHRHGRGSARIFDPGTVQIIVRTSLDAPVPIASIEQWRQEQAVGAPRSAFQFMVEPVGDLLSRAAFAGFK